MLAFWYVKNSEVKQCTEMSGKNDSSLGHFTIQRRSHPEMLE